MRTEFNPNCSFTSHSKVPIRVDERLWRGAAVTSPYKIYKLKKQGITQIIDLRNTSFTRPVERFFCKLFGIKYINYRYSHRLKNIPNADFFKQVNQSILNNDGQTYMHCQYGKRRTGICVAVYEKEHTNKSKAEIFSNLLTLGFMECKAGQKSYKKLRLKMILSDFINKYYSKKVESNLINLEF